jgi:hypothetical protein
MNTPLAALRPLPFEMFNNVRNVDLRAVDASLIQSLIQNFPRRSDEWMPGQVFLISRLFAYEHYLGLRWTFSENRLRGIFPEIAGPTITCRASQAGE